MTRRAIYRGLVLLLALAAWVTTVVAPAAIADVPDGLRVSSDGAHWATDLDRPLFDPDVLWVPGDRRTSSFYVENLGETAAAISVAVVTGADTLVSPGDVALEARAAGEAWRPVERALEHDALNTVAVAVDDARRIDVRAVFRAGARNVSQASAVALRFVVQLGDARAGVPQQTGGLLPGTGAPVLGLPLLLAVLLLAGGAATVRTSGRRTGVRRG